MGRCKKIVLTGGPCAGKTTAMQRIVQEFTEKGYNVLVIGETATELINGGIKPFGDNALDMLEFQNYVLDLQITKELLYERVLSNYEQDTIILCDRGIMDNRAYISDEEFKQLLKNRNINEMDVMSSYDLVIHLVTAADGAEEFYTLANNSARTETPAQAILADRKTMDSWLGHNKIEIIDNSDSFDDKIHRVIKSIYKELGDPYPIQRQYKFLVDSIDLEKLKDKKLVKLELEQFFTDGNENTNTMFRKTTKDGNSSYSSTIKKDMDDLSERMTICRNITEKEYLDALNKVSDKPLRKCRYCFTYNKQYYRLDVFEEPSGLAILEMDLTNKGKEVVIPDFIKINKDITNDLDYRNVNLYKKINGRRRNGTLVKRKINED